MQLIKYAKAVEAVQKLVPKYKGAQLTRTLQALGVDRSGKPLKIDGKVGSKTEGAVFVVPDGDDHPLAQTALLYALYGARETEGNNRGPFISHFFGKDPEDDLHGPAQWCAAFVSTCLKETYEEPDISWGARKMGDKLEAKGALIRPPELEEGDIITWERRQKGYPYAGHIGIVAHREGDTLYVIEGNAGPLGQVRVWPYTGPDFLRWERDRVWKAVRPDMVYALLDGEENEDVEEGLDELRDKGLPELD